MERMTLSKNGVTPPTNSANMQRAALLASRLIGFYPAPEVGNPETFLTGVIELFSVYPPEIIERAISVVHGIPSRFKWMPRISEIREFLDNMMPAEVPPKFDQLPPVQRAGRKTYEELQADCARDGLIIGGKPRRATQESVKEFREKFGITPEQWNAIPDRA